MNNIDNSLLIHRGTAVGEILRELTEVQVGNTDWFSAYPRDLRLAFETGLCLSVVSMPTLCADKALRYIRLMARGTARGSREVSEGASDETAYEEGRDVSSYAPLESYLYIGPPRSTLFVERSLSLARANFALAYEVGGYMAEILSDRCAWFAPRSLQCAAVWDALDPTPAQHQLWIELRALPRSMTPRASDLPASTLDIAIPYASAHEIVARELLAPWAEISAIFCSGRLDRHGLVSLLMGRYDLPAVVAARYHNDLRTLQRTCHACPGHHSQSGSLCSPPPATPLSPPSPRPLPPSKLQDIHWGSEPHDELDFLGDV